MHSIRLRGPWQSQPLARFVISQDPRLGWVELPVEDVSRSDRVAGRVVMPCDWSASLGPDFRGRVRYRRRFGCPTGIHASDSVQLVFDSVISWGTVTLNDQLLGIVTKTELPSEFEVTSQLRASNLLDVVVEHPAWSERESASGAAAMQSPGGLTGEVRLVIR